MTRMAALYALVLLLGLMRGPVWANQEIRIGVKDPAGGAVIKLEAHVYEPRNPNGQVIIFSHGSTGGSKEAIKHSIKVVRVAKAATDQGYRIVVFMRKGRGKSEGDFIEETGRCDRPSLKKELDDAVPQLVQVIDWAREKYGVSKVILMGHSRGGFLSTQVAASHPERVVAAINLAGAWSAICETKNNGYGREAFNESAQRFKNQYWAYFENDSYFESDRFNDPKYEWFVATAERTGVQFKKYPQGTQKDGHATPNFQPEIWASDVFSWLNKVRAGN